MTLLPGSQSLQLHIQQDDNDLLDDRAELLHPIDLGGGLAYPTGSWLRPQFRVALRKSPIVLTIWRAGLDDQDDGRNAIFTTSAELKTDHVYQIDPLDV